MTIQAEEYTGADGQTYRVWRESDADATRTHLSSDGYSSKCSHCYFGHTHSVAAHNAELKNK